MKELLKKAYDMGYEAFPRLSCLPSSNDKFRMIESKKWITKIKMRKAYTKGWARAFMDTLRKIK